MTEYSLENRVIGYGLQDNRIKLHNKYSYSYRSRAIDTSLLLQKIGKLGDTTHCRAFSAVDYPYQELFRLLKETNYNGWVLLEAHSNPDDKIAAMIREKKLFGEMISRI